MPGNAIERLASGCSSGHDEFVSSSHITSSNDCVRHSTSRLIARQELHAAGGGSNGVIGIRLSSVRLATEKRDERGCDCGHFATFRYGDDAFEISASNDNRRGQDVAASVEGDSVGWLDKASSDGAIPRFPADDRWNTATARASIVRRAPSLSTFVHVPVYDPRSRFDFEVEDLIYAEQHHVRSSGRVVFLDQRLQSWSTRVALEFDGRTRGIGGPDSIIIDRLRQ